MSGPCSTRRAVTETSDVCETMLDMERARGKTQDGNRDRTESTRRSEDLTGTEDLIRILKRVVLRHDDMEE